MEDGLGHGILGKFSRESVLILVLMEDGLGQTMNNYKIEVVWS